MQNAKQTELQSIHSRRSVLAAGTAVTLAFATAARADEHDHSKTDDHSAHDMHAGHDHNAPAKYQALVDAALKCVARGEICVGHCIDMLAAGDNALKDCLRSVQVMMPMCATLARAGALDTARLKEIAKVCHDICEDCEKECKKHADHHAACKACMQSCADCATECKKLI